MTNILRNAVRVLRAVFVFRFFVFAFAVVVFAIHWSVQGPLEAFEAPARFGSPLLGLAAVTVLFLFFPGLEERIGRPYLPTALFLTILLFALESGVSYLQPGSHFLIQLPTGQVLSVFWASTEMILMALIPCMLAGAAYGVRGALVAATFAAGLHVLSGVAVWLSGIPLRGFLALFPLRIGVLFVFPLISGYLADTWRREHEALERANRRLRGYAATAEHLATSRERVRLARDMHDTLAHSLSAVVVQLEAVAALQETESAAARQQLAKVQKQARNGLDEARRAIQNLRSAPVEELGLAEAIEQLAERFGRRNGIAIDWTLEGEPAPLLPVQANALYRVIEEALSNVERHAEARRVSVRMSYQKGVTLTVRDDGRGFDPGAVDANRYGLVGIHERAALIDAEVTVESAPNEGTTLTVHIAEPWED